MIEFALAAAVGGLAAYSGLISRTAIGLTRLDLHFSRLPMVFDGFSVLQLSDLHVARWGRVERRMERLVGDLDPDLVALTGDIAVSSRGTRLIRDFLARLWPHKEVLGIFGNTEHKGGYGRRRRRDLRWDGLRMLVNEHLVIERVGERIVVAGVDDPFTGHDDLDRALEGAPRDAFTILLAHAPNLAGDAVARGIDLMLCGHTHGGQIRFPLIGSLYSHLPRYKQLMQGLFEGERLASVIEMDAGQTRIYVSRGIGISNLPARFLCPPEIVLVTLRAA